jgi:hypothetical protein
MLPEAWKKEIDTSIQDTTKRNDENRERQQHEENTAIATPLNSLRDQFVTYIEKQDRGEDGKRRREIATIIGLFSLPPLPWLKASF